MLSVFWLRPSHAPMCCYYFQHAQCSWSQHVLTCCSLAAVPPKSQNIAAVTPDEEKPVPEDEEKLIASAEETET